MPKKPNKPKKKASIKPSRKLFICDFCGLPTEKKCSDTITCDNMFFKENFNPNY